MATRCRIIDFFQSLNKTQPYIHCKIGISRGIVFNVLTIIVKYRLKSENNMFNCHTKQIVANVEGVTGNSVLEFRECSSVITTDQPF